MRYRTVLAGLGFVVASAASALACSKGPLALEELADQSAEVLVGKVVSAESRWVDGPGSSIETELTLAGLDDAFSGPEVLKGAEAAGVRTVVIPGGTVGETTMRLCCGPLLGEGDRAVLFLHAEWRTYPAVGMAQGVYRLVEDGAGELRVRSGYGLPVARLVEGEDGLTRAAAVLRDDAGGARAEPVAASAGLRVEVHERARAARSVDRGMAFGEFRAAVVRAIGEDRSGSARRVERVEVDMTARPIVATDELDGATRGALRSRGETVRRVDEPEGRAAGAERPDAGEPDAGEEGSR